MENRCSFTNPAMDEEGWAIKDAPPIPCSNEATIRVIYEDASEVFACGDHKRKAELDSKKKVLSLDSLNPPVTELTDVKQIIKTKPEVLAPAAKPFTKITVMENMVKDMKTPQLKEFIKLRIAEGQQTVDSIVVALRELKSRYKQDKVWEKTLLELGIKPGTWRQWEFRELNLLTTGKRTGNRDGNDKMPKVTIKVPAEISQAEINAFANLRTAQKEWCADGSPVIAEYMAEAGITCTPVVPAPTPKTVAVETRDWPSIVANFLATIKAANKNPNKKTRAAISAMESLLATPFESPTPTQATEAPAPAKKKRGRTRTRFVLIDETALDEATAAPGSPAPAAWLQELKERQDQREALAVESALASQEAAA
jgi:hypothetical protein